MQPNICGSGGFTELKKIAAIANAWSVQLIPHVWNSILGIVARLHLVASLPCCSFTANPKPFRQEPGIEYDRLSNLLRDSLAEGVLNFDSGYLRVPTAPGLGVEIPDEFIEEYADRTDSATVSVVYE